MLDLNGLTLIQTRLYPFARSEDHLQVDLKFKRSVATSQRQVAGAKGIAKLVLNGRGPRSRSPSGGFHAANATQGCSHVETV